MKSICVIGFCLFTVFSTRAQMAGSMDAYPLAISYGKTTSIVFPYNIKSVDRGSRDVLAQKAKGVENVLQLKAGKENFTETNLSVITADGKLYSFVVGYAREPSELTVLIKNGTTDTSTLAHFPDSVNVATLQANADWVASRLPFFFRKRDCRYGMSLRLDGLYIDHDVFYYQFHLRNTTHITYDVDLFRLFLKDSKQSKRTASQELMQVPLLVNGNAATIAAHSSHTLVVALPKFTIPDKKQCIVQLMERKGGRHLQLNLGNHTIIRAQPIVHP